MSWNKLYSGQHYTVREAEAARVHLLVRGQIDPDVPPFSVPVDISVTAFFRSRPLDPDNVVAKLYIDGLCPLVITDDSMKYVSSVRTASRIDKVNPRVEILIIPAPPAF